MCLCRKVARRDKLFSSACRSVDHHIGWCVEFVAPPYYWSILHVPELRCSCDDRFACWFTSCRSGSSSCWDSSLSRWTCASKLVEGGVWGRMYQETVIVAARAYLLHLVGCTIFTEKSATSVNLSYLGLFVDLRHTGGYSWVAAALTRMYEQLGDGSYANTRQLVGYATLFSSWIYEHFWLFDTNSFGMTMLRMSHSVWNMCSGVGCPRLHMFRCN